jgi:hypothetical protein
VASCDGADLMLHFHLERRGDGVKHALPEDEAETTSLFLVQWTGSMTRCSDVTASARREAALGKRKGGDDTSWADTNLIRPKNNENPRSRFSCFKWMMKI